MAAMNKVLRLADARGGKNVVQDTGQVSFQGPMAPPPFLHLIRILLRRRRLIVAIAIVGTMLAMFVALLVPPQYTAVVQLTVHRPPSSEGVPPPPGILDEIIDTHLALISSQAHSSRVAASLLPVEAAPKPEPGLSAAKGATKRWYDSPAFPAVRSMVDQMLERLAIWIPRLSNRSEADRLAEELFSKTKVLQERRSRLISVSFTSTDPSRAAAYANRIADLYVTGLFQQVKADAAKQHFDLGRQVASAGDQLTKAQLALQSAMRQRVSLSPSDAAKLTEMDQDIRELRQDSQDAAEYYNDLLRRSTKLREAQMAIGPGISVRSSASVPTRPSSHNPLLFIIPTAFLSVIAASWLALMLEGADRGLRSEKEIECKLGLSCLGLVPRVRRRTIKSPKAAILRQPSSLYTESMRNIAAALQVHHTGRGGLVALITSSMPGEGKSVLAKGLSAYFATLDRRVLLIDLDIVPAKHSSRARDLLCVRQAPSARQMGELIKRLPEIDADYLGLSQLGIDPLLFFEPGGLPSLIKILRKSYDVIILSGPPVLGASEARLLPAIADSVLFVVRWASTRQEVAEHALSFLHRSQAPDDLAPGPIRAVLTQVQLKQHARFALGDTGEIIFKFNGVYTGRLRRLQQIDRGASQDAVPEPPISEGTNG
ncbi:Wzz/FepE/Etk N-terminal domain-containing protein [Mesorhizobium muleiense]|uniref:Chromosome partitioning ATPase, Mrp family, contains Fe-S cluster n=1 Tax=Mesorhizobium muleiense TaxID=1004279 RepID=A0A1G8L4L3_9HYPH|nr:Wzz/FepE/Etk N-terminal domain-containing protein [Mesorhizobium muleiense]MCF6100416.1 Wzz/FepE/Etk N-terminal domain-containing protein [Mesorhizobium muleiense]SDI50612.1 Chromosome partitioning ATPase, Mrp family, contains Fe-S cluster [Mesorhizobium muleiense]